MRMQTTILFAVKQCLCALRINRATFAGSFVVIIYKGSLSRENKLHIDSHFYMFVSYHCFHLRSATMIDDEFSNLKWPLSYINTGEKHLFIYLFI